MDWLKIALFSILDNNDEQSNNYIIATYILQNYDCLPGVSLTEMSKQCNISKAAISRFCKELGLIDYIDLQMLIRTRHSKTTAENRKMSVDEQKKNFIEELRLTEEVMSQIIDNPLIEELVEDLCKYSSVYIFGHLQANHVALTLRSNLAMNNKLCSTAVSWISQKEKICNATEKDLIIVFSSSGSYFKRLDVNMSLLQKNAPKIYMITTEESPDYGETIRRIFIGKKTISMHSNIRMNIVANYLSYRFKHN